MRVGSRLGQTMPAHCTSSGRALLSMLDDKALRELYPRDRLIGLTPHSITKRSALMRQVKDVRESGFATSTEESGDGNRRTQR